VTTAIRLLRDHWFGNVKIDPDLQASIDRAEAEQIMWIEGAISASESAPPIRNWPPQPEDDKPDR
jgi:hypothetical protein